MKLLITGTCALALTLGGLGASHSAFADTTMPSCSAGDSVVWENTSTKVYHAEGDKYYGKTKHGQYACKSDADKAGFHLAKSRSMKSPGATSATSAPSDAPDTPDASPSPAGKHKHHHRHGSSMTASPSPAPSAT